MNGAITYSDVQEAKCEEFKIREAQDGNYTVRGELEKMLASIKAIQKIGTNTTYQDLTDISDKMFDVERDMLLGLAKTVEVEEALNKELEEAMKKVRHLEGRLNKGGEALERAMRMRVGGIPKHNRDIEIVEEIIGEK